jgi:hypothetical protein
MGFRKFPRIGRCRGEISIDSAAGERSVVWRKATCPECRLFVQVERHPLKSVNISASPGTDRTTGV